MMEFEIKLRLQKILLTLLDLLASKKFLVAISSSVAIYQATGDVWGAMAPIVTYLFAQGLADFGKEAKPAAVKPVSATTKPAPSAPTGSDLLALLPNQIAYLLINSGFGFVRAVRMATDEELLAIPGMNKAILAKIRELLE